MLPYTILVERSRLGTACRTNGVHTCREGLLRRERVLNKWRHVLLVWQGSRGGGCQCGLRRGKRKRQKVVAVCMYLQQHRSSSSRASSRNLVRQNTAQCPQRVGTCNIHKITPLCRPLFLLSRVACWRHGVGVLSRPSSEGGQQGRATHNDPRNVSVAILLLLRAGWRVFTWKKLTRCTPIFIKIIRLVPYFCSIAQL